MGSFKNVIFMYCGKYCVWFKGCMHISLRAHDTEFIVEP
jgi:hypothetical protein